MRLVTGPDTHIPRTHSQWVAGPGRTPQKWAVGHERAPNSLMPHTQRRGAPAPPGTLAPHPQRLKPARKSRPARRVASDHKPGKGTKGPSQPPPPPPS